MKKQNVIILSILSLTLFSCSSMKESVSLGAGTGALAGASTSMMSGNKGGRSTMTGAAVGALIGGYDYQYP